MLVKVKGGEDEDPLHLLHPICTASERRDKIRTSPPKKRGVLVASRPAARLKKSLIGRRRYPIRKLERRVASRARGLDGCGDFNSFVASLQMVFLSVFHDAFMLRVELMIGFMFVFRFGQYFTVNSCGQFE